jgi:glycosyltransferase involved in cell wall biosynthesis
MSDENPTLTHLHIVFAHNRYRFRGGEDESREQEMTLLRSHGHHITEYIVDNRDISQPCNIIAGFRSVWNGMQYDQMRAFLRNSRPDILKVDNFFPLLSPAIFDAAKSMGVATLLSVRNYRLICPAATLFRNGEICTQCVGSRFATPALRHRCYRDSVLQSSAVVLSNAYGHMHGTWHHSVDQYIAVSRFVMDTLVRGGFPEAKISVKPNCISDSGVGNGSGHYAMFVGRLIPEKGLQTLLDAWRKVGMALPLKIIGEGVLEEVVRRAADEIPGVEYLGRRPLDEVCHYLGHATVLVFPSEWLEPFGRSIIEAYSKGTPAIGADTVPMRDMIEHERTGVLFTRGSSDALAAAVFSLLSDSARLTEMRVRARERYENDYSIERNYRQMMQIFDRVLSTNAN